MKNNKPDLYASEASVIGDVPKGAKAEDKIELTITAANDQDISINAKKRRRPTLSNGEYKQLCKTRGGDPSCILPIQKE